MRSGGLEDQPQLYLTAMSEIANVIAETEREEQEASPSRGRRG